MVCAGCMRAPTEHTVPVVVPADETDTQADSGSRSATVQIEARASLNSCFIVFGVDLVLFSTA